MSPLHRLTPLASLVMRCTLHLKAVPRLSLLLALPFAAQVQAQDISFAIPAQPMASALQAFGQQSKLQVLYNPQDLQGLNSTALNSSLSPTAALAVLLGGSGLSFSMQDDSLVLVSKPADAAGLELGATTVSGLNNDGTTEGTHAYVTGRTTTATKLPMSLRETPQSVTVVTRQRMNDQGMKNLDDVMQNATGISVVKNGSERSLYMARGQQVESLQVDGIPTNFANAYSMDAIAKPTTDIYDRVEIVRGATGLMEGAGNPSASINLIRKRPTLAPQALIETSVGSWDDYKTMVDLSAPLNSEGTIRGRTVLTYNNANSYMDTAKKENQLFYGILEADLTDNTMATLGYSFQKERNSGYDWSGLPTQADGSFYPLSRSTSLTGKWNHLNKHNTTIFGDIQHYFANDWKLVVAANQTWAKSDFLGNYTARTDDTGDRFSLNPRHFRYSDSQIGLDTYLSGPFQMLGKQHDLILGSNIQIDNFDYHGGNDANYKYEFDINDPGSFNPPKPTSLNTARWKYSNIQKQAGIYAAGRFSVTDSTKLILGSRFSWYRSESMRNTTGIAVKTPAQTNGEVTPYAGIVQELNENFSAYASYTEIFKPQTQVGIGGSTLAPMTGSNYELGLKGEFLDKRLTTGIALFQSDQTGRAVQINDIGTPPLCNVTCYRASDKVRNRGIDLEINGALTPDWNLSGGYTYTQSKYIAGAQKGDDFSASSPRHLFKIATDYRLSGALNKMRVGGSFYAQSKMTQTEVDYDYKIQQKGYTLTNLHATYEINPNLEVQYNLDNVFDKKYIQTTGNTDYWNFYGEPRNFNLALRAKF